MSNLVSDEKMEDCLSKCDAILGEFISDSQENFVSSIKEQIETKKFCTEKQYSAIEDMFDNLDYPF